MFRSLYSKLAGALLGLFVLVGIAFVLVSIYSTGMYQQEVTQKLNSEVGKHIVSEKIIMENNRINQDALEDIFHMLMVINPSIEVYLLDPEGHILAFSADPGKVKREKVSIAPLKLFLEEKAIFPLRGDDPRNLNGKKVFTAARIPEEGRLEGYLYVILGGEIYDSVIQKVKGSYILQLSLWALLASLSVAVTMGLIIFACLTRRLKRLAIAMDSYESGTPSDRLDLPTVMHEEPKDEIDRLASTFKEMARRIEQQVASLKQADSQRRELVADVSHDLRTPMATLQGYIETLLMKDDTLSQEERRNYLDIAIRHCNRLNKLVADFFELAKLEAHDMRIHREPFNMGELVQDVVQKFELRAHEKKITIVTNIGSDLPFVSADIALAERVLENLLENAIRHTPQEGSVSIVLRPTEDNVEIRLSDTGPGIPDDERPRIFDRFYQLDKSRKGRSGHSGLGLAITKQILELHGTTINVESSVNRGTTFSFVLPLHRPGQ